MPTVLCVCQECGNSFYMKDELYTPGIRNPFKVSKKDKPTTWDEWLEHLTKHCENCRLKEIPNTCLQDLEKLKNH